MMKRRLLRRAAIALAVVGFLLLAASCLLALFAQHRHEDNSRAGTDPTDDDEGVSFRNSLLRASDPGGFRRFQDDLVRRKEEEMKERASNTTTTRSAALQRHQQDDEIVVSEAQAREFIRLAGRWNEDRRLRVQEVCARHNLGLHRSTGLPDFKLPPTPQYSVFYYDRPHKMAWCPLYKAGSTSWLYSLCLLGGYSDRELRASTEQLSTLARKAFPELEYPEAEEALSGSLKVLVVRHPFARLLSAYRDKLENRVAGAEHGTAHFYRKYGRRIVDKYRPGGAAVPTGQLVRRNQVHEGPGREPPAGDEPTFKEFVRYLIDVDLANYADDHWIPYYLFCTPCLLNYDIIAKVETYLEDQVFMIRALNLQDQIQPRWRHKTTATEDIRGVDTVSSVAKKYFSQLSRQDLHSLYAKYRLDFELFDYSMDDYLPYVSPD